MKIKEMQVMERSEKRKESNEGAGGGCAVCWMTIEKGRGI